MKLEFEMVDFSNVLRDCLEYQQIASLLNRLCHTLISLHPTVFEKKPFTRRVGKKVPSALCYSKLVGF